jgi:uncharacterized protein with PhoU and TrkA domain
MSDKRLAEISKELDSIEFRMKKLSDDVKALKVLAEKESKQMKEILSILYFLKELEDAGK